MATIREMERKVVGHGGQVTEKVRKRRRRRRKIQCQSGWEHKMTMGEGLLARWVRIRSQRFGFLSTDGGLCKKMGWRFTFYPLFIFFYPRPN